jgi:hypothetical protein
LDPKFNPFDENYLAEIMEALIVAWTQMKQPRRNEIEDRITYRLAGRLANDDTFAELPYDVVPQYWLLGLNGERLGRLDLRFKHRNSQRDYFALEAKRLHVRYPSGSFSTGYPSYAGVKGMMSFITGYYSKRLPACGMIGYVMDSDSGSAWIGIDRRISAQRLSLRLTVGCRLKESVICKTLVKNFGIHLGETEHDLGSHQLLILHLLLPVLTARR